MTIDQTVSSETARRAMIDSQLRTSGVNDPAVLAAVGALAREDFVPAAQREAAYIDRAVPLGNGRYLAPGLVHGRMLAEAEITAEDKVLVVDGGSGYLPALTRKLTASVDVVDAAAAASFTGSGYSLILIDGAIEVLPEALVAALADGGRVVTGVAERSVTRVAIGRKIAGAVTLLPVADLGIPVLPEFAAPQRWSF